MNTILTEIVFLIDRSGSMAGLEKDTIGGFNALIENQNRGNGETKVTAALFDDQYEVLWSGMDAGSVRLTEKEYWVRGTTALLDAAGRTIVETGARLAQTREEDRPGKVIFVITTDGMENASMEFSHNQVSEMIKHQREVYGWEFIFLGANIDAAGEAEDIGIDPEHAYQFEASSEGVRKMYSMADTAINKSRRSSKL
ncbi:vWA domain-containing protein [Peribacillus sp. SCS-37]|uniref:vWA domain-containing protein n=1 Tax=Paraperibacillus esterisolvens TaxID=3115296 RepID=UPI0039058C6F